MPVYASQLYQQYNGYQRYCVYYRYWYVKPFQALYQHYALFDMHYMDTLTVQCQHSSRVAWRHHTAQLVRGPSRKNKPEAREWGESWNTAPPTLKPQPLRSKGQG